MKIMKTTFTLCILFALTPAAFAQDNAESAQSYSPYTSADYAKNVYFGDTHLHTSYSPDAGLLGNQMVGPTEAFRFASGEAVKAHNGMMARLNRPLDFLVVADHAEYFGIAPGLFRSDPELLATEKGKRWIEMIQEGTEEAIVKAGYEILLGGKGWEIKDKSFFRSAWARATAAADQYNQPGKFTAFIGFEWTSMPGGNNLHRVVIFKDDSEKANQVLPFSALDSEDPEDLWSYLHNYQNTTGGNVLAIAHNGNVSNGLMFLDQDMKGKQFTPAYAKERARWEPLYEVTQMKGDGEAHPFLSPDDEFADYETWDRANINATVAKEDEMLKYEYAREALKSGLRLEVDLGTNPFKFGMIGSTDAHTGFATADENNQWGKLTNKEPSDHRATAVLIPSQTGNKDLELIGYEQAASGYAAVWATENTREAIFEAMQRKETYATTGPRMIVRFFGGWDYDNLDVYDADFVKIGYENGVPMGGDLTQAPDGSAPKFIVAALRDPDGANLDRIQIVKGWMDDNGKTHEKVYDAILADGRPLGANAESIGSTVDIANASYKNTIGDPQLSAVWSDPDFDAEQRAFYYVRVIEIPTPRWTAYDANFFKIEMPEGAEMTTQERAYTSPIWYTP